MKNKTSLTILEGTGLFLRWPCQFVRRSARSPRIALVFLMGLTVLAPFAAAPNAETIATFADDCSTPQAAFILGDTVCAVSTGSPLPVNGFRQRRFRWVAPDGSVVRLTDITTDPQNDSFTVPSTGALAQVGTWNVASINNRSNVVTLANFVVRDPNNASADLTVNKLGPVQVSAGGNLTFTVRVTNLGPDDALNVQIVDATPAGTTFVSENQDEGPPATCVNPSPGSVGTSTCTIASLPANSSAVFRFTYQVDAGAGDGTAISNTVMATSDTNELRSQDNTSTATAIVQADACTIVCPSSITTTNDPGECGAVVSYPDPTPSGTTCGVVLCSPPSGSFFPVGVTQVVCAGDTGDPCSFTVTVNSNEPPAITCPADVTAFESSPGSGSAMVTYPTPTVTGACSAAATVLCSPPSGSTFPVGATTVTCTASDDSGNTASCTFTVTVIGAGCQLTCPPDIVTGVDPNQCGAAVSYAAPVTSGSCGTVTCSPPSGSFFPVGSTTVTCTSSAGPACSFTVTVNGQQLTALGPAMFWVGLKNSDDVGTRFDFLAEVFKNGVLIGSGEIDDEPGGSSGFNNAILRVIEITLADQAGFCSGDTLSLRLSVRIAVGVPGHASGTARLWFNDSAANSRVSITTDGVSADAFLLDGFVLGSSAGPGPKKTIDVLVKRVDGPTFKPFGTWTKTL
jgi:uncharacterized repeat protein (TIGR01451 family)